MEQLMNHLHGDDKEPSSSKRIVPVIDLNSDYNEHAHNVHIDLNRDPQPENGDCSSHRNLTSPYSKDTGTTSKERPVVFDIDLNLTLIEQFGEEGDSLPVTSLNSVPRVCDSSVQGEQQAQAGYRRIHSYAEKGTMVEAGENGAFQKSAIEASERAAAEILTWMRESDPLRNGSKESEKATVVVNEALKLCNESARRAVGAFNPIYDRDTTHKRARCLELFPTGTMNDNIHLDARIQPRVPVRIRNPLTPTLLQTHRELEKRIFGHLNRNSPFAPKGLQ